MSLSFSSSEVAATDLAEPLTNSPITRGSEDDEPSATRTTLTSEPFALNPSDKAALKVASPHAVGGYVLRMAKLAGPERPCPTRGTFDVSKVDRTLKVIPTDGCHRLVRRELALYKISGGQLISSGTGWAPTLPTLHPVTGYRALSPARMRRPTACRLIRAWHPSRAVPLGLLGRVTPADEDSDGLVDNRSHEKACRAAPFGRGWQVPIEDEVTRGAGR